MYHDNNHAKFNVELGKHTHTHTNTHTHTPTHARTHTHTDTLACVAFSFLLGGRFDDSFWLVYYSATSMIHTVNIESVNWVFEGYFMSLEYTLASEAHT